MQMTVTTLEARKGFYPTPPALAAKLLNGINIGAVHRILEPSAGTGNLIRALAPKIYPYYYSGACYGNQVWDVDCCEIDMALRGILAENFSERAVEDVRQTMKAMQQIENCDEYDYTRKMSEASLPVYEALKETECMLKHTKVRIVNDDFLTYETEQHYDLILMNPPFANGDLHLLKAIQMQKRGGGQIRCILNAETIRNPYTNRRKLLNQWLQELEAEIEFVEGAFKDAERETDVEVALIKIDIPKPELLSEFWTNAEMAQQQAEATAEMPTDLVLPDIIKQFVARYKVEIKAGVKLIREYVALSPYIMRSATKNEYDKPILMMGVGTASATERPSVNEYISLVRRKYWALLFQRKEFTGQLTKNLQEMLNAKVNEMVNFEFSEFNIRQILHEMHCAMQQGVVETILELFETLTVRHSVGDWSQNIHYFNGWKSNKAHYINPKKCIIPGWVYPDWSWSKETFQVGRALGYLSDIEKALNYLDGHATEEVKLDWQLNAANQTVKTKNIYCKYFSVTFYKKGTIHIVWHPACRDLIDRFNIFCARQRNWLPPCYGKTTYSQMDAEEKAVVDSFHGDGTEGSGEKAYANVLARANYYLAPANNDTPLLDCGSEED